MGSIAKLSHVEAARLDQSRIEALVDEFGEPGAERLVGRALDTVAVRLGRIERAFAVGEVGSVVDEACALAGVASEIGLSSLDRVARDVARSGLSGDYPALAATVSRLTRIGEESLMSVCDMRGGTV